jgi:hypothetical protein
MIRFLLGPAHRFERWACVRGRRQRDTFTFGFGIRNKICPVFPKSSLSLEFLVPLLLKSRQGIQSGRVVLHKIECHTGRAFRLNEP